MNISLVIITLNAEKTLERCLNSCHFIQDIVIVDSGSVDNTVTIAKSYGARVVFQEWLGFGLQKKYAVSLAKHDWVLCLDADEWLSDKLIAILKNLKEENNIFAYYLPRCNQFLGKFLKYGEGYPDWCLRLFNRNYANWSEDNVHESVICDSKYIKKLIGDLLHESGENLFNYLEKQNKYTTIQAEEFLKQNKNVSISKIILSPTIRFIRFYFIKRGFLDGFAGFVHILIGCFFGFIKYVKLFELKRKKMNNLIKNGIKK